MSRVWQQRLVDQPFVMGESSILRIHQASLDVLGKIGVVVQCRRMRTRLCAVGCRVADDRVYMPEEVVIQALSHIPPTLVLSGRDQGYDLALDGREMYGCSTGVMPYILDPNGSVRPTTLRDLCETTRLSDALPNIHMVASEPVEPRDVPPEVANLEAFAAVVRNTAKPLWGPLATNGAEARYVVELGSAVRGGSDALRERPFFFVGVCPLSPLIFVPDHVDAIEVIAEAGIPIGILPAPVMGLTAPITVAGALTQLNAESLAGMVMVQLINPGCPMIRLGVIEPLDPRTATVARGSPELGLTRIGYTQLAQFYDHPFAIAGFYGTSAKTLNYQSGYEKAINGLMSALLRPDILMGAGGLAGNLITSLDCLVLDDEVMGMLYRVLRGYQVNDDTLGLEAIRLAMDEGETFVAQRHTARHLRTENVWVPELAERAPFGAWLETGQPSVLNKTREKVERLLANHRVPQLSSSVDATIDRLLAQSRAELCHDA